MGFIGLGLLELDRARALTSLRQYLTPEGDEEAAYIQHGSPVPVQLFLAHELWNRCQDAVLLDELYPSLRQWHRHLRGEHPHSTTDAFATGLLATWDHFYNSGGWDDYPAQVAAHRSGRVGRFAPMVTSCMAIATARILRRLAQLLGRDDAAEYTACIARLGAAIQAQAWDEAEGWFGYVEHDADGHALGLLRHPESGANHNRGLDGCYPLVAGICTPAQETRLLGHLADPERLGSAVGLSAVDQSAPYFSPAGYWNGAVWMPHQWFFWKSLLDLGQADLAHRIASTALEVWAREHAVDGRCCEIFRISSGRGSGWHHFGGLSSPVLPWFHALHRPGTLTGGHGFWITAVQGDARGLRAQLALDGTPGRQSTVLCCLEPGELRASWNGDALRPRARHPGLWELDLPADGSGELVVGLA